MIYNVDKVVYERVLSNTSTGSSPPLSPRENHIDTSSSTDIGYDI